MKNLALWAITGLTGLTAMTSTVQAQESLGRIRVGAPFPEADLPALADGKQTSLKLFRGRPTILIVFASW